MYAAVQSIWVVDLGVTPTPVVLSWFTTDFDRPFTFTPSPLSHSLSSTNTIRQVTCTLSTRTSLPDSAPAHRASFSSLPPEVLLSILAFLPLSSVPAVALLASSFTPTVQYHLFTSPLDIHSLPAFDSLLDALNPDHLRIQRLVLPRADRRPQPTGTATHNHPAGNDEPDPSESPVHWADVVRTVSIVCHETSARGGWGVRVGHLLTLCQHVRVLRIVGVEDLRVRQLVGSGSLHALYISTTTFRAHALPSAPSLAIALSNLTSLTLHNLGLPHPATHLHAFLSCVPRLSSLTLSAVRDISSPSLQNAFAAIPSRGLTNLSLAALTSAQATEIPYVLRLTQLSTLVSLTLTLPMPFTIFPTLLALPSSLQQLSLLRRPHPPFKLQEGEEEIVEALVDALGEGAAVGLKEVRIWEGQERAGRGREGERGRGGKERERLEDAARRRGVVVVVVEA